MSPSQIQYLHQSILMPNRQLYWDRSLHWCHLDTQRMSLCVACLSVQWLVHIVFWSSIQCSVAQVIWWGWSCHCPWDLALQPGEGLGSRLLRWPAIILCKSPFKLFGVAWLWVLGCLVLNQTLKLIWVRRSKSQFPLINWHPNNYCRLRSN